MYILAEIITDRRVQFVLVLLLCMGVAVAGWYGYSVYRNSVNEHAQQSFAIQLDIFEKAIKEPQSLAWESIAQGFSQGYQDHKSSDMGAFFKIFESEALWRAGKTAQAYQALKDALHVLRASNPFYYIYATKLAIMECYQDPVKGKQELQKLADNIHNPHRGWAWYELWAIAVANQDKEAANRLAQKLMSYQQQGAQWGLLAQSQLQCHA